MFQSTTAEYTEKDFLELTELFEQSFINLESNSVNMDLSVEYTPTWACAWNKPSNIGKPCKIFLKNDKLILVSFDNKIYIPDNLYRIEDLILYKK